MPGAGFEPARSCEQRFLRPPAYAIRLPGRAPQILRAPGAAVRMIQRCVFFSWLLNVRYAARGTPFSSTRPPSNAGVQPLPK
jgi:hypothetical protein